MKKNYIVGRQKDMDQPLHDGNIEYAMFNYTTDKKGCERLAEQYNRTGFQGLEKEKFAGV
ncbi:MAG: hypothetical protein IJV46_06885 [Acidaminococcaceae bacterium]|nr:hypothetical protein [Acidaminococcaceae bacterium]